MLDLKYVVNNIEEVREKLSHRGAEAALEPIVELSIKRRELIGKVEELRRQQNEANQKIQKIVKEEGPKSEAMIKIRGEMKEISQQVKDMEPVLKEVEASIAEAMLVIPNLCGKNTPLGKSEDDNVLIRTVGEPKEFDFEPKWHDEIGSALDIMDLDRASKLSGARFAVLKGAGARLERALIQFMLDLQTEKHGYTEMMVPLLVNAETMQGTGQLPKFKEDAFLTTSLGRDMYLIPTAEVPVTNLYSGEVIKGKELPIRMCAYTPCFRSEAGSHGQDVRGYLRQHQFNKVELIHICKAEDSYKELETLTANAEKVLQLLELPYRVISLCTGDIGFSAAMTYDLEVWLPGQQRYREISSCSNCEDFQARRMKMRFKEEGMKKPALPHTLNGSGLAAGRAIVAILENYQQEDGSVIIPKVLRPYMGGIEKIG